MKVGRDALDEEAIRLIEESNPDVEFDWVRILKGPIQTEPRPNERRQDPAPGTRHALPEAPQHPEPAPVDVDQLAEAVSEAVVPQSGELEEADVDPGLAGSDVASAGEGTPAEIRDAEPKEALADESAPTAAHRRLGSQGVSRLRARHSEIMARITERIADPIRRDELKSAAERLNPDTWVTDDEVRDGLEQYEAVFESLRSTLGRRRKRRRRGGRGGQNRPVSAGQLDGEAPPTGPEAEAAPPSELPDESHEIDEGNDDESDSS